MKIKKQDFVRLTSACKNIPKGEEGHVIDIDEDFILVQFDKFTVEWIHYLLLEDTALVGLGLNESEFLTKEL